MVFGPLGLGAALRFAGGLTAVLAAGFTGVVGRFAGTGASFGPALALRTGLAGSFGASLADGLGAGLAGAFGAAAADGFAAIFNCGFAAAGFGSAAGLRAAT